MAKAEPNRVDGTRPFDAGCTVSALTFCCNRSSADSIAVHLWACDAAFRPHLSARVSIADYAARLAARAECFEAWAESDLVGLAALYCNAEDRRSAFLTDLSVVPHWARRGIARRLLGEAIRHARAAGFSAMGLSVDREAPALGLYRAFGFRGEAGLEGSLNLSLDLSGASLS